MVMPRNTRACLLGGEGFSEVRPRPVLFWWSRFLSYIRRTSGAALKKRRAGNAYNVCKSKIKLVQ
jgi:hypothetical protein